MSGFSGLGIGSGLDLGTLVAGLVRAEREPVENRINRNRTRTQTTLSALGTLKSAVARLDDSVAALSGFTPGMRASSSDATAVAVAISGQASPSSWQVRVLELASAQSLASAPFSGADEVIGAGALTVQIGGDEVTLEFDADATLADVAAAINSGGLDVQAAIVRDGDSSRLLLTSGRTGSDGAMVLSVTGGLDPRLASAAMDETAAAGDAVFVVNGLQLSSASNVVDDVLPGVTLTLRRPTEDDIVAVRVEPDRQALKSRLDAMLTAYNALVDNIRSSGRADPQGGNSGPLVGDATLRSLQTGLSGIFSSRVDTGAEGPALTMMLELGVSTDVNGRATLDAARFEEAFAANRDGVESLVIAFGDRVAGTLERFAGNSGVLGSRSDSLNAQLLTLARQQESLDRRMEQLENRLRAQFTALDGLLAQFQSTSTYLAQQLSAISNLQPGGR